ncbi:MAG: protoglobin domain-containing protein [Gallionella sp.]
MTNNDLQELADYAKGFSGFTPARQSLLSQIGPSMLPRLPIVTERFYEVLLQMPEPRKYLEGRVDALKSTHLRWLTSLFSGPFELEFAAAIHRAGQVHVRVDLPIEFMAGGMTIIGDLLIAEIEEMYSTDPTTRGAAHGAINAVLGFCLIVMQEALQESTLNLELDRFMKISGISRALFNNLAAASK